MVNLFQKNHPSAISFELSDLEKQMVAIINRLVQTNRKATKANIIYLLERKKPDEIENKICIEGSDFLFTNK